MKLYILLFSGILLFGCNCYKNEEFKAIEDITNDYLFRNNLNEILNPPPPPPPPPDCLVRVYNEAKIPNIDSLDLKVYISDALLPISQIKEDNEWMFTGNNYSIADSLLYQKILNSRMFRKLGYREFNKHKLSFIKPYRYFEKYNENLNSHDSYSIISFSRVCFDNKQENGIIVINYETGYNNGNASGYFMSLLIKKVNGKWTYIEKMNN